MVNYKPYKSLPEKMLTLSLIIFVFINVFWISSSVFANNQSDNGSWIIDKDTVIEGAKLHIDKNITIKPGAYLAIANSIIYINSKYNGGLSIKVDKGASLEIINSTIRSGTGKAYLIYVYGTLIMRDSVLRDCGIQGRKPGLLIEGSNRTIIRNSFITSNYAGITIYKSKNIEIIGNKISFNEYGISITNSKNIVIAKNEIINNKYGIYSYNSSSIKILNNYFEGGGLYIDRNLDDIITGNKFIYTGVTLSGDKIDYYKHVFKDNLVNGKPLIYVFNESKIISGDIGMAIIAAARDVSIYNVSVYNTTIGIGLYFSYNITIYRSILKGNEIGIEIKFSRRISLLNSNLEENSMYGLKLYESKDINVHYNSIVHNSLSGIVIMDSSNIIINYNNITKNDGYGIYAEDSSDIDAKYNWWGSMEGPEYKEQIDLNEPEEIYSSNVKGFLYDPWLRKPVIGEKIEVYNRNSLSSLFPYIIIVSMSTIISITLIYYFKIRSPKMK